MMRVVSTPLQELALTNCAYCSPSDMSRYRSPKYEDAMALVNDILVLTLRPYEGLAPGSLALNAYQRRDVKVSVGDILSVESFDRMSMLTITGVSVELDALKKNKKGGDQVDARILSKELSRRFQGQVLSVGQKAPFEYLGTNYSFHVISMLLDGQLETAGSTRGLLAPDAAFQFLTAGNSGSQIINQQGGQSTNIFKGKDLNFQKLGLGGLDAEFQDIFRRAFASRVCPPHIIAKLGIPHVKGLLLFGPPGTGKTLIARQIGKMLNGREPKVVNGPEVLSKFVGETEKNFRDLFADAENDQKTRGDQSDLHIIIIDEIDAICQTRGSTRDGTGVHDSIFNQLLTKIDGVEALNNILLIGMTNRMDLLDEALLQPGRMEVQTEIGLPDEKGRFQILSIHCNKMKANSFLSADVDLKELASRTKKFSGAELEGLVRSAASFALNREVNPADLSKQIDEENIKVTMDDFRRALKEVEPPLWAASNTLEMCSFDRMSMPRIPGVIFDLDTLAENKKGGDQVDARILSEELTRPFEGQVLSVGQKAPFEYIATGYSFRAISMLLHGQLENDGNRQRLLAPDTAFQFLTAGNSGSQIINQQGGQSTSIFKGKDLNFQKLGIGGLDAEFQDIFRRAFASRVFPPHIIAKLGIPHVKGLLLFGPPGTGKTLIARQIGKMLNGREPKVVNGPEVLSKFVGETEKNVRDLFADAENDQKTRGDQSDLHIIIIDEIDAICQTRGSTRDGTGVHDSIVNQLLTKMDGVEALNNILLIGMTNRKDLLDEALLRPGRMEVQIEIGLPDEKGRFQILSIHCNKMKANSFLSADVDLKELASRTKNCSGAELEGLVKSATSFALNRQVNPGDFSKLINEESIKVTMDDFISALKEVKSAFGAGIHTLEMCRLNGMLNCGEGHAHIQERVRTFVEQVRKSERTPLLTCLLEGPGGSGKTALAATIGIESGFPFIKIVSAENMIGLQESTKCAMIAKVFEDAYKSPLSIIILDDIERLLEFVAIGPRFSNVILQTILVLLKRIPPKGCKLLVIGTSSLVGVLESMRLLDAFNVHLNVPKLKPADMKQVLKELDVFDPADVDNAVTALDVEIPIKRLLMLIEMAAQGGDEGADVYKGGQKIEPAHLLECLQRINT